jgi:hypothetical protein
MPIIQNFNLDWLSHNSQRRYPLTNDASATDTTGNFSLPDDFIVGLKLVVPIWTNPASFTLHSVKVFATGFAVTVGYWNGSQVVPVASAAVLRSTHTIYRTYQLTGLRDFYDVNGHITIGTLDSIDLQPPGDWQFNLAGGRLEVDAIGPQIRGVSQLFVQNGSDLSAPIVGDVVLKAGNNVRITVQQAPGEDPIIVLNAVQGEGLNEPCVCEGDNTPGPPILTINHIPPSPDGDFTLIGTSCTSIESVENGLRIDDKCSKPCCGCEELKPIVAAQQLLHQASATLQSLLASLESRVTQMDQIVLGSRLGDQGCSQVFRPT